MPPPAHSLPGHGGGGHPPSYPFMDNSGQDHFRPELPRPLEPRTSHQLQTSYSESPDSHHHHRHSVFNSSQPRPHSHSLPGVRDILDPRPQVAGSPVYPSSYGAIQGSTSLHHRRDSLQPPSAAHPPLALHPPVDHRAHYAPPPPPPPPPAPPTDPRDVQPRHTPLLRQPYPQQLPPSPYGARPDAHRDPFAEQRPTPSHQDPNTISTSSSLPAQGNLSPYTPNAHQEQLAGALAATSAAEGQSKYLGVRDFPGEGTFHVYENGYRIPTQVDGEAVNPAWGLTKANKPRKRLAIACLDCREKKIKCEPGLNSCLQCEKAKRPCRRPANQATPSESTASVAWSSAGSPPRTHGVSDPTPGSSSSYVHTQEVDSANKRRHMDDFSPNQGAIKKHRSASPSLGSAQPLRHHPTPTMPPHPSSTLNTPSTWPAALSWDSDPLHVDERAAVYLMDLYFSHVNSATYNMFPRRAFLHWFRTAHKCADELMLTYAMLAVGSIFAGAEHHKSFGGQCAQIAKDAAASKNGKFSLLLAQSRMLLALYSFANDHEGLTWDYCGGAVRVACGMRLNTEEGCSEGLPDSRPHWEFHFTKEQLAECRRRTFWSLFLMDRFVGFCCGTQCSIATDDIFLRLPLADELYERGVESDAPYFNNGIIDASLTILTPASRIAPMAWLALVTVMWGEVQTFLYRAVYRRPAANYEAAYQDFYDRTEMAMQGWLSRLPEDLKYRQSNLDKAIQLGYGGTLIDIHTMHHFTLMKLNRWARHAHIRSMVTRNIGKANFHAQQLLHLMQDVQTARRDMVTDDNFPTTFQLSTATAGYATLSAIDIVTAGGLDVKLRSTIDNIDAGLAALRELSQFWASAKAQSKDASKRAFQLQNVVQRPHLAKSGCWLGRLWGLTTPLEQEFGYEDDCIYGVDNALYYAAFEQGNAASGLRMN